MSLKLGLFIVGVVALAIAFVLCLAAVFVDRGLFLASAAFGLVATTAWSGAGIVAVLEDRQ